MTAAPIEHVTVQLEGEIDIESVARTRTLLSDAIDESPGAVVEVDMAQVTFLDSIGVGMLVGMYRRAAGAGGALRVVEPHPHVRRLLDLAGLAGVFLDGEPL